eukprot:799210_1
MYNYSIWYHQNFTDKIHNLSKPQTLITNTIKHMQIDSSAQYQTYIPIHILFTAYDMEDNVQNYGGDEFVVLAESETDQTARQAFYVEDLLNGTYMIPMLFS